MVCHSAAARVRSTAGLCEITAGRAGGARENGPILDLITTKRMAGGSRGRGAWPISRCESLTHTVRYTARIGRRVWLLRSCLVATAAVDTQC